MAAPEERPVEIQRVGSSLAIPSLFCIMIGLGLSAIVGSAAKLASDWVSPGARGYQIHFWLASNFGRPPLT